MNRLDAIPRVMALLGLLLPAMTLAGDSARLTIGGTVLPRQRVAVVQTRATDGGQDITVLQEQSNSTLGYTVTVETKDADRQAIPLKQAYHRNALFTRSNKGVVGGDAIRLTPAPGADTVVITVASQ